MIPPCPPPFHAGENAAPGGRARTTAAALALACVAAWAGCSSKDNTAAPHSPITFGNAVQVHAQAIADFGGVVSIDGTGSPLDGLLIEIPSGSYPETRTFEISYFPIEGHTFGTAFHPVTPMIAIANGGGYADAPMVLHIPCRIPADRFGMAFVYDEASGRLEGLPFIAADSVSVTVSTRTFARSDLDGTSNGFSKTFRNATTGQSLIVVSTVDPALLDADIDAGFQPGTDDFSFANHGSIVTPEGEANGQSVAAFWYYTEKRKAGSVQLFGRFDNDGAVPATPLIWQDDVLPYRFCSIAQLEYRKLLDERRFADLFDQTRGLRDDVATRRCFAYAMLLNGEPQLAHLWSDTTGHAVVVYRVSRTGLTIADPNFPGSTGRTISFSGTTFAPYLSGESADLPTLAYTELRYAGASAWFDFLDVAKLWEEVGLGTIGNGIYPDFTLLALDEQFNFVPLVDGFSTTRSTVDFGIDAGTDLVIRTVFDEDQHSLPFGNNSVPLTVGTHRYGFVLTDPFGRWVGFRWVRITRT